MISRIDGSLKEASRLSWASAGSVHEGWGSTWNWMDKSIVMGVQNQCCFGIPVRINVMVKVRSKESERELRASESKRARRIEALDLRSCTARYHAEGKAGTRWYFVRVELDGEWMESLYR